MRKTTGRILAILILAVLLGGLPGYAAVTLPAGVDRIDDEAYRGDTSVTSVTLPETLSYIGKNAFAECTALESVYCFSDNLTIENDAFGQLTDVTIYCDLDSTMESFALEHGYTVKYLNAFEITNATQEMCAPGLPVKWKLTNVMPGKRVTSRYSYEVYCEGTAAPVYTASNVSDTSVTFTPAKGGNYTLRATISNSLTETTLDSEVLTVPDALYMGVYEQDGNAETVDPIAWKVLCVSGTKALVITERIIKNGSYFNPYWIKYKYTYWSGSYIGQTSTNYRGSAPESAATRVTGITPTHIPLSNGTWGKEADLFPRHARYWCNTTFYNGAFTDAERKRILLTSNVNEDSTSGVEGGPDTQDHIYFLSYSELQRYMPNKADRNASMTPVAKKESKNNTGNFWWLRTPGKYRVNAMYVLGSAGTVSTSGSDVGHDCVGYRPVMWIRYTD